MIYITGDCHGSFKRFTAKARKKQKFQSGAGDYLIICGDFGLCWERNAEFEYNCKWLGRLPFTILWVQGNHENYDMIGEFPCEIWKGGKVRHIVRDKIILLERGQIFRIDGRTFFTFDGASSHDVEGGILDPASANYSAEKRRALRNDLSYRVIGRSWWEQELPSEEEIREAENNLSGAGYRVDYVITHCASNRMQQKVEAYKREKGDLTRPLEEDILTAFFEKIEDKMSFKCWYFGHYHEDMKLDDRHMVVYQEILECPDAEDGDGQ